MRKDVRGNCNTLVHHPYRTNSIRGHQLLQINVVQIEI